MSERSQSLTYENACVVVDLLIDVAPIGFHDDLGRRDEFFRDAFTVAVRIWPETNWPAVSRWLRSEEQAAWKVADVLDAALAAEQRRQQDLR